jgi:hypothetical protein
LPKDRIKPTTSNVRRACSKLGSFVHLCLVHHFKEEKQMRQLTIAAIVFSLVTGIAAVRADEAPKLPAPVKEHEWLKQLVGEWESESEAIFEPGKPPVKGKGTETVRSLGGFWVVGNGEFEMVGMKGSSILTLGYDPDRKKYVGTWVDSMTSYLWKYEGTVDPSGKVLTLETEGPCPMAAGKTAKFREVIEFKSKDHRTFASSVQGEDGKWTTFLTVQTKRKK